MDRIKRIDRLLTIFPYEEYPYKHLQRLKDSLLAHVARTDDRLSGLEVDYMKPFKDYLRENLDRIPFHRCSTTELAKLHKVLLKYMIKVTEELNERLGEE